METLMIWSLLSFIVYALGSAGYLVFDILALVLSMNSFIAYIVYIALAGIFVVESILHTLDWFHYACSRSKPKERMIHYVFKLTASIFHIVGSVAYLLGAIFGANTTYQQQNFLSSPQIFVCTIVGMGSLVIEAIVSIIGWMLRPPDERRCHCSHGLALWAHLFNIIGALLYLAASVLSPILAVIYSTTMNHITIQQNYIRAIQIAGDGVYLFDSFLFIILWIRERKKREGGKM